MMQETFKIGDIFKILFEREIDGKLTTVCHYYILYTHKTNKNKVGLYAISPLTLEFKERYRKIWHTSIEVSDINNISLSEFENITQPKWHKGKRFEFIKISDIEKSEIIKTNSIYKITYRNLLGDFILTLK